MARDGRVEVLRVQHHDLLRHGGGEHEAHKQGDEERAHRVWVRRTRGTREREKREEKRAEAERRPLSRERAASSLVTTC